MELSSLRCWMLQSFFFSGGILFNLDHDLEKGIQGWQYAMPNFLQLHPHNLHGKGSQAAHFEAFCERNLLETQNESPENNLTLQNNYQKII